MNITCSDIQVCFFWAFGPAINVFHLYRHVISTHGCHLKGSYKGKMFVVVKENANNNVSRVSYAIINEDYALKCS